MVRKEMKMQYSISTSLKMLFRLLYVALYAVCYIFFHKKGLCQAGRKISYLVGAFSYLV